MKDLPRAAGKPYLGPGDLNWAEIGPRGLCGLQSPTKGSVKIFITIEIIDIELHCPSTSYRIQNSLGIPFNCSNILEFSKIFLQLSPFSMFLFLSLKFWIKLWKWGAVISLNAQWSLVFYLLSLNNRPELLQKCDLTRLNFSFLFSLKNRAYVNHVR